MQPEEDLHPIFNKVRRRERDIAEMLGIARGILFDGVVNELEAEHFATWYEAHPDVAEHWAGRKVAERLRAIFEDGKVDSEEQAELREILEQLSGTPTANEEMLNRSEPEDPREPPSEAPLCDPPPAVTFKGKRFYLSGNFAMGSKPQCAKLVEARGGVVASSVTKSVDFVVMGALGSSSYKYGKAGGGKIDKAARYRDSGTPIHIVSEEHWAAALE